MEVKILLALNQKVKFTSVTTTFNQNIHSVIKGKLWKDRKEKIEQLEPVKLISDLAGLVFFIGKNRLEVSS